MRTAGIDLSSQDEKTWACCITWSAGTATVERLDGNLGDAELTDLIEDAGIGKVGIDVPLGWPVAFAAAVAGHSADGSWPNSYEHKTDKQYRLRATDRHIQRKDVLGMSPLSVSTDWIGIPAMRAAALLSRLPERVALDGSGKVVEVYPAAALRRWGLPFRLYKGKKNAEARGELVDELMSPTFAGRWLSLAAHEEKCRASDDALDALVAALVARASWTDGLVDPIPAPDREAAVREGWIALPTAGSLSGLATG